MQRSLNFDQVFSIAHQARADELGARLLHGQELGGIDAAGRTLGQAARPPLSDANAARKQREAALAAVLGAVIARGGPGELRHGRGKV